MLRSTLKKNEILRNSLVIESLFLPKSLLKINGLIGRYTIYAEPFKCVFMLSKVQQGSLQTLFAVPKRNFKRAVKRNLMRRRMKEAYRLCKNDLKEVALAKGISISVHICYYSKIEVSFDQINDGLQTIIKEIHDKLAGSID